MQRSGLEEAGEMYVTAILVGAGSGERFGRSDKILTPLAGRPLIAYSLDTLHQVTSVQQIIVVIGSHTHDAFASLTEVNRWSRIGSAVSGGATRHESVRNGIAGASANTDMLLIHDAARPFATVGLFEACIAAAAEHGAAIAATPVVDTLKRVRDGLVDKTVSRESLWGAQTPQAFNAALLIPLLAAPSTSESAPTDEAALFEAAGLTVAIVPAPGNNLKITYPADLALAEALLAANIKAGQA